jgi:predicted O-linked N-acetylglucosamine transferase (SPINDLY family)
LVDLSGHTVGFRPGVLLNEPAPIIIEWCGYPNSTGLSLSKSKYYRLTDIITDNDSSKKYYTEELIYISGGGPSLCFSPGYGLGLGLDRFQKENEEKTEKKRVFFKFITTYLSPTFVQLWQEPMSILERLTIRENLATIV